jgi:ABC-type siderophore export system fused ATPase/permease subunit
MSQIDKSGKKLIKSVLDSLKKQGKTMLLIDHDHKNLDIADKMLILKNNRIFEQ